MDTSKTTGTKTTADGYQIARGLKVRVAGAAGGARPGAGRPGLGHSAGKLLQVRVSPQDRERYDEAAREAGVPLSEWVRLTLDRALARR